MENLYAWDRYTLTDDAHAQTLYATDAMKSLRPQTVIDMIMSPKNVDYLIDMVVSRADPLRNATSNTKLIREQVNKYLTSWVNMGKFDSIEKVKFEGRTLSLYTTSPITLLDHYNKEFMMTFAETILPTNDITRVTSVVNPGGLYAQQERIITINSKPVPFYEAAIYKRLTDFKRDSRIDETENLFYVMDKNPNISDEERKKRNMDGSELDDYRQKVMPAFRANPGFASNRRS